MMPENISPINRLYYPLSEAIKALKVWGKTLSIGDLLHYGVLGKVRFFIHVPSGIQVRGIQQFQNYLKGLQPSLLILSPLHCSELECNRATQQSLFPSAYPSVYSFTEIPGYNNNFNFSESMCWQTIDSQNNNAPIRITPQTICISHTELSKLSQFIDEANRPPGGLSQQLYEQRMQEINLRCYSFEDALKIAREKISCFTERNLLRYGYYEKLSFLTPLPANISISIVEAGSTPIQYSVFLSRPDMLRLDPEDCYQIEIFGQARRYDYRTGFRCMLKTLIPYPPSYDSDFSSQCSSLEHLMSLDDYRPRVKAAETNLRWHTCSDSKVLSILHIRKDNIFVIRSEFDPLIDAASRAQDTTESQIVYTPNFSISEITQYHLSPKKFVTLSEAAELTEYSEAQLLINTGLEFLTPVPCEIALCQAREPVRDFETIGSIEGILPTEVDQVPQLLVLGHDDCKSVAAHGKHKQRVFKRGYSFEKNELVPRTPYYCSGLVDSNQEGRQQVDSTSTRTPEPPVGVWLTFYQDKPIEIEITSDRIFLDRMSLNIGVQTAETLGLIRHDETANVISANFSSGKSNHSAEASTVATIEASENDQSLDASNGVLGDTPEEIVTITKFLDMAKISRSTLINRTRPDSRYYDPEFPIKITNTRNGRVHFKKLEVDAWIAKNRPRDRK